ncbi:hypothetical protein B0T22DRAFT_218219 [Podospora appendiculata]|uniref:Uncharacterized protein n=1 Tax=Podospora appendiculata TaxID=314037 RepID=A0AAE1CAE3_9PEZI|nr:hypothetical protein B0T22DRAFT_195452 [Podospora appendiculata]KAK3685442.1 hypothetical protein B0T22DRAFT_218219 [Podospora appendiculata]
MHPPTRPALPPQLPCYRRTQAGMIRISWTHALHGYLMDVVFLSSFLSFFLSFFSFLLPLPQPPCNASKPDVVWCDDRSSSFCCLKNMIPAVVGNSFPPPLFLSSSSSTTKFHAAPPDPTRLDPTTRYCSRGLEAFLLSVRDGFLPAGRLDPSIHK